MLPQIVRHDPRTTCILEQVKAAFAAKGFDGASMQDLARAAGMSAGNFYRYFSSKNAIVEAMIAHDLAHVQDEFAEIMGSPDPRAKFLDVIRNRISTLSNSDGPLWAEIEAASGRNQVVGEIAARMQAEVSAHLVRVFARIAQVSDDEAARRFSAHATLMVMLVKGMAMRSGCGGARTEPMPRDLPALVMRVTEQILDEIQGRRGSVGSSGE